MEQCARQSLRLQVSREASFMGPPQTLLTGSGVESGDEALLRTLKKHRFWGSPFLVIVEGSAA